MGVINLSDFFILNIKGNDYRVYIVGLSKKEAVNVLNNIDLGKKRVI